MAKGSPLILNRDGLASVGEHWPGVGSTAVVLHAGVTDSRCNVATPLAPLAGGFLVTTLSAPTTLILIGAVMAIVAGLATASHTMRTIPRLSVLIAGDKLAERQNDRHLDGTRHRFIEDRSPSDGQPVGVE